MVNSEGENEAQLLLGSKLGDHLLCENLFLGLWRCSTWPLIWRRLYISDVEYFEFDFFEAVACGVVLDGEQDFEMFTHANLSKRWIEVYGIRSGHTIEGYVWAIHQVFEGIFVFYNLHIILKFVLSTLLKDVAVI